MIKKEKKVCAYLGEDTEIEGDLSFNGTARIDGAYKGEISAEGRLIVGETADIESAIRTRGILVSGKISEVNEELEWEPTLVNESPYDEGWLVKIEMSDPAELDNLMKADSPELKALIEEEAEKYKDILS